MIQETYALVLESMLNISNLTLSILMSRMKDLTVLRSEAIRLAKRPIMQNLNGVSISILTVITISSLL